MTEQVKIFSGSKEWVEKQINSWFQESGKDVHVVKRRHLTTVVPDAQSHRIEFTIFIYYTAAH